MRTRAGWALAGGWVLLNLLLAAGVGPSLDDDALASTSIVVPGLACVTVTLLRPRHLPARLLWSGPWSSGPGAVSRFIRPYLPGLAAAAIAGAYLGTAVSLLRGSTDGAGLLLTTHYIDWTFFAVVGVMTTGLGFVVALALMLPLGAALDARGVWDTDRLEARRLLAFTSAALGAMASVVALVLADPNAGDLGVGSPTDRWASATRSMHMFVSLLTVTNTSELVTSAVWVARLALALLLVALVLYWAPARGTSRTPGSSRVGENHGHGG